jgi:hypothetical protein
MWQWALCRHRSSSCLCGVYEFHHLTLLFGAENTFVSLQERKQGPLLLIQGEEVLSECESFKFVERTPFHHSHLFVII